MQPNWLFGTVRDDESEDNLLLHKSKAAPSRDESMKMPKSTIPAAKDHGDRAHHSHSARELHQQVPNAPSATNDRIKLLQMSATRRGIAAGMRM